jgi:hypothetical protein
MMRRRPAGTLQGGVRARPALGWATVAVAHFVWEVWPAGAPTLWARAPRTRWGSGGSRLSGKPSQWKCGMADQLTRAWGGWCAVRVLTVPLLRHACEMIARLDDAPSKRVVSKRGEGGDVSDSHSGVHSWSAPHPHSAPHPLRVSLPGAQIHHRRGQWPHSALHHTHTWSGKV